MTSKPADYPGADDTLNAMLRFLVATAPQVMLDAAALFAEKWNESGKELAQHILNLHANFEVEDAIWKAKNPDKPA